jgi:hypothetical protein
MATTIREQLTNAIAPVFRLIEHIQILLRALLSEIAGLIQRLEVQVESLLQIEESLRRLYDSIRQVVAQLNSLDISFITREIEAVFDAVKTQLEALDPQRIGQMLQNAFDSLLDALDPDTLLGLPALDSRHSTLLALLQDRDPKKVLTDTVQPAYDKIVAFLRNLDVSILLETFLKRIESLQTQLSEELDRVTGAYDEMIGAIPDTLSGEIGISFQTS